MLLQQQIKQSKRSLRPPPMYPRQVQSFNCNLPLTSVLQALIYYTCHCTYFYISSAVVGKVSSFSGATLVSLKRLEAATRFSVTRGRRRIFFPALPLPLLRLVREEAGEGLRSRNESHRQATSCRAGEGEVGEYEGLITHPFSDTLFRRFFQYFPSFIYVYVASY